MILAFPLPDRKTLRLADDPATKRREIYPNREALKRCGGWYNGIEWQIPASGLKRLRASPSVQVCIMRRVKVECVCHLPECWTWGNEGDVKRGTMQTFCAKCDTYYNSAQILEVQLWHHGENTAAQSSLPF